MEEEIVKAIKNLWETWDIRGFLLVSLLIQSLLTFLAPLRKRCANSLFGFAMWLLYQSADAIALFTIGLIANSQIDAVEKHVSGYNSELLVFWAPFLLLHLGGPETITALSLEDNQLWRRHALQLVTQVVVILYVFFVSIRRHNGLRLPTALIFLDGCVKYVERICALYSACTEVIRDSLREPMPPNYDQMMEEYRSAEDAHIPSDFEVKYGPSEGSSTNWTQRRDQGSSNKDKSMSNVDSNAVGLHRNMVKETDKNHKMIRYAFFFYNKSKGLLADSFLKLKDDGEIREYFLYKDPKEAFKILEIELNLIYDVLHTKVFLNYRKRGCLRLVSFLSVVGSLLLFHFKDKSNYKSIDIGITFALLLGAIFLDVAAAAMLLCSDWWIIIVTHTSMPKPLKFICSAILRCSQWLRNPYCTRWSRSISCYNLLYYSFRPPRKLFNFIFIKQIKDFFIKLLYVKGVELEQITQKFIIQELQQKANLATCREAFKEVCSARGNLVMQDDYFLVSEYLLRWTVDVDYDESLLIWHLATDICYWAKDTNKNDQHCRVCKQLSDYMSYLLLSQQTLLSQLIGKSDVWFDHTIHDIHKATRSCTDHKETVEELSQKFSEHVLHERAGDISQSMFHEACRLAKQLTMFGEKQWEIMSKVWVELLSYAAIHSSATSHLAQLSKGAELITFVWLFMVHLGFREPLQPSRGLRCTKLIIHK